MTTIAHKLGPGRLTFGAAGSAAEWGGQITKCTLTPASGDVVPVLDGGEVSDDSYTLDGEIFQDYTAVATSLLAWCKAHKGEKIVFHFQPDSTKALGVTGSVNIRDVPFGGEVKKRNTSAFSFNGVGDYTFETLSVTAPPA